MVWIAGSLSNFVPPAREGVAGGTAISYAIGQGSTMVGPVGASWCGRNSPEAVRAVNRLLVLMFVLFLTGLGVVSIAPLFAR